MTAAPQTTLRAPRLHPLRRLAEDVRAVRDRDPAARSTLEVVLLYPGVHALLVHRLANRLWRAKWRFVARLLSQAGRGLTGIEIHPGAIIGRRLFMDHGMGIVIGETAEIGDDVTLYQGVTLGGTSLQRVKRHPTLMDGVVVGAGAIILGAVTVGEKARIGAGAVVVRDVPAGSSTSRRPLTRRWTWQRARATTPWPCWRSWSTGSPNWRGGSTAPRRLAPRRRPRRTGRGSEPGGGRPVLPYLKGGPAGPRRAMAFQTVS
jgi:serine O-acetyltransferase